MCAASSPLLINQHKLYHVINTITICETQLLNFPCSNWSLKASFRDPNGFSMEFLWNPHFVTFIFSKSQCFKNINSVKDAQGLWWQNSRTWRGNSRVLSSFPAKQLCQILMLHTHLSIHRMTTCSSTLALCPPKTPLNPTTYDFMTSLPLAYNHSCFRQIG